MKTKQLIERNLPFNQKYVYMGITRGSIESGQLTCCDNCGKLITNMVKVINNETKKQFTIGTDCAETLVKANCMFNNSSSDYQMDIYSYNQVARFVTELNAGCEMKEVSNFWFVLTNRKGKEMQVFKNDMQKFFPEML